MPALGTGLLIDPRVIAQHRTTGLRQPIRDTAPDPPNPNNAYRQRAELTGPLDLPVTASHASVPAVTWRSALSMSASACSATAPCWSGLLVTMMPVGRRRQVDRFDATP